MARTSVCELVVSEAPQTDTTKCSESLVLGTSRISSGSGSQSSEERDVELTAASTSRTEPDPFFFKGAQLSEEQLSELRQRKKTGKRVENYQRRQNDLIDSLLKSMEQHTQDAKDAEETTRLSVKIAVWASLLANFSLCVLQLYAAISAGSLSLLATGIDAVFDMGSNVVLLYLHRKANKLDLSKWPVGGSRLETIGNIVYGFLMASVNLVVIVESIRSIISHTSGELNRLHIASLIAVGAALAVKFVLFVYCFSLRKVSSQVRILWEDHRNDLFINGFGLFMSAGGSQWRWWLDPMGAIIIAAGVIISWGRTIHKQFELLAGKSAPHDFIKLITYKAMTFSDDIEKIDTIRAYHSGPEYYVEVDVVMPGDTPLWKAHDLSQQLQDKLEILPNVGRAFVHVDHETTHTPEHRKTV